MTVSVAGFMLGARDLPPPDGLFDLMWIVIIVPPTNCFLKREITAAFKGGAANNRQ
jgi:hypothetical protein